MALLHRVNPQVIVSRSYLDPTADDGPTAFSKYNVHEHNVSVTADFLAYDLSIDDPVYIYNDNGEEIILGQDAPRVSYITSKEVLIGGTLLESIDNGFLYYREPRGNPGARVIPGISADINSQVIRFASVVHSLDVQQTMGEGASGFLTSKMSTELCKQTISSYIVTKTSRRYYPIIPHLGYQAWPIGMAIRQVDSTPSYRLTYNSPSNSSFTIISPDVTPTPNSINYVPLMFYNENVQATSLTQYPSWRSKSPLPIDCCLFLEFLTEPSANCHFPISVTFHKVIY